jgi:hypothetical protein
VRHFSRLQAGCEKSGDTCRNAAARFVVSVSAALAAHEGATTMTSATLEAIHTTRPASVNRTTGISKTALWAGRVMSGLVTAFLTVDAVMKLVRAPEAIKGTVELGYQASVVIPLGIVLAACVLLYSIPRTAVLGAVFLTGYLGGAIATHVRVGNPLASHVLFPVYVAIFAWGGLYLRDRRVRALIGPRS